MNNHLINVHFVNNEVIKLVNNELILDFTFFKDNPPPTDPIVAWSIICWCIKVNKFRTFYHASKNESESHNKVSDSKTST